MKKIRDNRKKNQKGSAAIFFMFTAAAASVFFLANINSISDMLSGVKKSQRKSYEIEKFLHGVLNYTVYAVKERWCMDSSWGQDETCGGTAMKDQVLNKLNLERLLWSQTANNAIKQLYQTTYSAAIPENPAMNEISVKVPISSLSELELSHPLNLSLSDPIKRCLSEVEIKLNRSTNPSNQPVGDEKVITINIRGIKSDAKNCESIPGNLYLKSTVAFYPRTLNQFALIKSGNLDVEDFKGLASDRGVRFHSGVYVENDFILRNTGTYRVGFYDAVRVGGGNIRLNMDLFNPKSFGRSDERIYDQFPHVMAIKGGITLENKVDTGLSPLFGSSFTYPANTLLSVCIERAALKDNPSRTRNSRLWVKGKDGKYVFALSQDNEFREYSYPYAFTKPHEVFAWDNTSYKSNFEDYGREYLKAEVTNTGSAEFPIMKFGARVYTTSDSNSVIRESGDDDPSSDAGSFVLGRDSEGKVAIMDPDFLTKIESDLLDKTKYLDRNDQFLDKYRDLEDIKTKHSALRSACKDLRDDFPDVASDACKKVRNEFNDPSKDKTCDDQSPSDKPACNTIVANVTAKELDFENARDLIQGYVDELQDTPPEIQVKMNPIISNKQDVEISILNEDKLSNPLVKDIDKVQFTVDAFDFGVEGSNNAVTGKRTEWSHLPGPNDPQSGNTYRNYINLNIERYFGSRGFRKVTFTNGDNDVLTDTNSANDGWMLLKEDNYPGWQADDPPKYWDNDTGWTVYLPEDGMTIADAKRYDTDCSGVSDASAAEWDISFTDNTQFSWLYSVQHSGVTIDDPSAVTPKPEHEFLEYDMDPKNYKGIPTISIVKNCIVKPNVELVFGFYVCETLTVQSRSKALKFIGTIITKNIKIENSAKKYGIDFFSVWHPLATEFLRIRGDLKKTTDAFNSTNNCKFNVPGWSPFLSEDEQKEFLNCSPMKFVIQGANNFNWTTVDPEIGIPSSGSSVTTQSKIPGRYRRFVTSTMWIETGVE